MTISREHDILEEHDEHNDEFTSELIELFGLHPLDQVECAIHEIKSFGII